MTCTEILEEFAHICRNKAIMSGVPFRCVRFACNYIFACIYWFQLALLYSVREIKVLNAVPERLNAVLGKCVVIKAESLHSANTGLVKKRTSDTKHVLASSVFVCVCVVCEFLHCLKSVLHFLSHVLLCLKIVPPFLFSSPRRSVCPGRERAALKSCSIVHGSVMCFHGCVCVCWNKPLASYTLFHSPPPVKPLIWAH